ncbi:uncharacterized protein LOC128922700 [Zeugodacus cucurbitae]|uniref:uncharacterized protein LOC128922700 n=1 Tax=Zeugodacus cucurbitae TaxID=28588 RepID=UPI0023D8E328|nr:uncharacterized protein LOC128922700 [Zeugodacus cucurbitae]
MNNYTISVDSITITSSKYNLRRQTRKDSTNYSSAAASKNKLTTAAVTAAELQSCHTNYDSSSSSSSGGSLIEAPQHAMKTDLHAAATCSSDEQAIANNPTALIALQQLASISSVQSLERIMPTLRKNLLVNTDSLYANRSGKLPRQSSKRLSQFETNRCPLCSRVYRSQAFLNEHMRKEHSVLI